MTIAISPARLTRLLLTVVCCLLVAHVTAEVLRMGFGVERFQKVLRLVDLAKEANLPTWFSAGMLVLASALLAIIALHAHRTGAPHAWHWSALALIFLGLSIDETAEIHEMTIKHLRALLGAHGVLHFTWVVPGAIVTAAIALAYLPFLRALPSPTGRVFVIAGAMYVGGALGLEMLGGYLLEADGRHSVTYAVSKVIEETLEMVGVVVFLHGLTSYIAAHIGPVQLHWGDRAPTSPRR